MRRISIALLMVFCMAGDVSLACSSDDATANATAKIRLPRTSGEDSPRPVPGDPKLISTLSVEDWYVVEADVELIALQSPNSVLDIEPAHGPITVRGKFADGTGKIETRTYTSNYVYFVTAMAKGKTELILIPLGVQMESEIVRQELTVTDGTAPNPPPNDDVNPDPPKPEPPQPKAKHVRLAIVEDTLNRSIDTAMVLERVTGWNAFFDAGNQYRLYDLTTGEKNGQRAIRDAGSTPVPSLVVYNMETDEVVKVAPLPKTFDELVKMVGGITGG
jgi:hypothetical protein